MTFNALSVTKYGSELLQELVKISNGVKVLNDTLGNKMVFPDVELTKLEDIVKMMKSSDELKMLKNGSAAGKDNLTKIAQEGVSEIAQTGLKALRGAISREGLAKAKEQIVTLNIARIELIERLDDLPTTLNLSQRGQSEIRAGRNSLIRNLTQDDLVGALRDINGKPVRQIGSGKTWDHLQEVRQGVSSLKNAKNGLIMEMKNY